jgi:hypothetical protein
MSIVMRTGGTICLLVHSYLHDSIFVVINDDGRQLVWPSLFLHPVVLHCGSAALALALSAAGHKRKRESRSSHDNQHAKPQKVGANCGASVSPSGPHRPRLGRPEAERGKMGHENVE